MKIEKNNHYFTIAIYIFTTSVAIIIAALAIFNFREVITFLCKMVNILFQLLKPLIFGIIIAYLLDPIVAFYDKKCKDIDLSKWKHKKHNRGQTKKNLSQNKGRQHTRTVPTLLTFITIITLFSLFVLVISMNIQDIVGSYSLSNVTDSIDKYIAYFENMLLSVMDFTNNFSIFRGKEDIIGKIYGFINAFLLNISNKIFSTLTIIGLNAMNVLLACVIAFYLLQDKTRACALMHKVIRSILPSKIYAQAEVLGRDIDYVFSGYIRGQIIDASIIAVLTSIALTVIQLDFAIIIGLIAGVFNLIPYFGPVVGFILAGIIGVLDPNPMKAVYGVLALMIIQQIDGWFIVPKVVGECVKLHPIVVLLSILIGGNLFGLVGMLIGVPVAAFIRLVLLRYLSDIFPDGDKSLRDIEKAESPQKAHKKRPIS